MIDNNNMELNDTQRLKQALAIVSGRLDVINTRLQALSINNHELDSIKRYAQTSVQKSDEIFKHLRDGTTIKP